MDYSSGPGNDGIDKQSTTNQTTKKADNNHRNDLPSVRNNGITQMMGTFVVDCIVAGLVGTGLWAFGERLNSHGHPIIGGVIVYFAICVFFAGVPLAVLKYWNRPRVVWCGFVVFCMIIAGAYFWPIPPPPMKSRLDLSLRRVPDWSHKLELTNSILFFQNAAYTLNAKTNAYVVVPLLPTETNVIIGLFVENHSSSPIESAQVICAIGSGIKYTTSGDWKQLTGPQNNPLIRIKLESPIFPRDRYLLPDITLLNPASASDGAPFKIIVQAKDMEETFFGAFLITPVVDSEKSPFVGLPRMIPGTVTNNLQIIPFISSHDYR